MTKPNPVVRLFRILWRVVQGLTKVIQFIVILSIITIIVRAITDEGIRVPDSGALVVAPHGMLVEELEGDPFERAFAEAQGNGVQQTLVRDVIESLETAAEDDRIKAVVLRLEDLDGGGLSKLQTIGQAILKVRENDKKVIAIGDSFTQNQYYLAAYADEIYMHKFGVVLIDGYGYFRTYFKSALDKLSIDLNIFRVGEYKSFVEPFIRDDMSEEDKEASQRWLEALWSGYQTDVVEARGLETGALESYAAGFVTALESVNGNTAQLALEANLVDELLSRDAAENRVTEIVGVGEDEDADAEGLYDRIDFQAYLAAVRKPEILSSKKENVAVIVAAGEIIDGEASPGTVGGDSLAALISRATKDEAVKAVVLRVDSPGGSMFASEVVYEQLETLKASGKPLIVSMSSVAASGGYYIAMLADQIWASESTITGSIGIGALVPTFQRGLERLGIHVDGFGTTPLSGQLRVDRKLGPDARRILQATIDEGYRIFVGKVAQGRDMTFERADSIARGRVWIGTDALDLGLVDDIGGLDDALNAAAEMAGLEEGQYGVTYMMKELSFTEQLALQFAISVSHVAQSIGIRTGPSKTSPLIRFMNRIEAEISGLAMLNDPRGIYFHCFCAIR
jgi:protease-4